MERVPDQLFISLCTYGFAPMFPALLGLGILSKSHRQTFLTLFENPIFKLVFRAFAWMVMILMMVAQHQGNQAARFISMFLLMAVCVPALYRWVFTPQPADHGQP